MIDTSVFEPKESRWGDIYTLLKTKGFDVYPPGIKIGECVSPYVVVSISSSSAHTVFSTDIDLYSVMCYIPKLEYSKLEPLVQSVKKAMCDLKPMILPYGIQTPSFYDDEKKAHMVSIEYMNYKKRM